MAEGPERIPSWMKVASGIASFGAVAILTLLGFVHSNYVNLDGKMSAVQASVAGIDVGLNGGNGAVGLASRLDDIKVSQDELSRKFDSLLRKIESDKVEGAAAIAAFRNEFDRYKNEAKIQPISIDLNDETARLAVWEAIRSPEMRRIVVQTIEETMAGRAVPVSRPK